MFWSWRCLLYPPYELTVVAGLLFSIYVFLFPLKPNPSLYLFPLPFFFSGCLFFSSRSCSIPLDWVCSRVQVISIILCQKKLISARYLPHITRFTLVVKKPHQPPCLQLQLVFFLYSSLFHYRWLGFGTSLLVSVLKSISIRAFCLFL